MPISPTATIPKPSAARSAAARRPSSRQARARSRRHRRPRGHVVGARADSQVEHAQLRSCQAREDTHRRTAALEVGQHLRRHLGRVGADPSAATPWSAAATTTAARSRPGWPSRGSLPPALPDPPTGRDCRGASSSRPRQPGPRAVELLRTRPGRRRARHARLRRPSRVDAPEHVAVAPAERGRRHDAEPDLVGDRERLLLAGGGSSRHGAPSASTAHRSSQPRTGSLPRARDSRPRPFPARLGERPAQVERLLDGDPRGRPIARWRAMCSRISSSTRRPGRDQGRPSPAQR